MPPFSKLAEKTFLPLFLLIFAKFSSIFVISFLTGSVWNLGARFSGVNLLFINFDSVNSAALISNLSDLIVMLVCSVGFAWTLYRFQHLTVDNLHPKHVAQSFEGKSGYFLTSSSEIFIEATVWFSLATVSLIFTILDYFSGLTGLSIVGFSLAITLGLSYALFRESKRLGPLSVENVDN